MAARELAVREAAAWLALYALTFAAVGSCVAATRLSLTEAVALAITNNSSLNSDRISRKAERFDLRIAERKFVPLIELTGSVQRASANSVRSDSSRLGPTVRWTTPTGAELSYAWAGGRTSTMAESSDTTDRSAELRQPLLKGAGLRVAQASVERAQLQEQLNLLRHKDIAITTVSNAIVAYRALQRTRQAISIAQSGLKRAEDLLGTNESLVSVGRLPQSDLLQNRADLAAQRVSLSQAEVAHYGAQRALALVLSLDDPQGLEAIDEINPTFVALPSAEEAFAIAEQQQPAARYALLVIDQAKLDEHVAANERLPDVALFVNHSRSRSLGSVGPTFTTTGLQWTIPLNDLSQDRALVQAQAFRERSELEAREVRIRTQQSIRQVLQSLGVLRQQIELATTQVSLAKQKLSLELEKLNVGRTSNFQVLSYEADLRQAEMDNLDAVLNYQNGLTELDQVLGTSLRTWGVSIDD